jgi:hypothetical protein
MRYLVHRASASTILGGVRFDGHFPSFAVLCACASFVPGGTLTKYIRFGFASSHVRAPIQLQHLTSSNQKVLVRKRSSNLMEVVKPHSLAQLILNSEQRVATMSNYSDRHYRSGDQQYSGYGQYDQQYSGYGQGDYRHNRQYDQQYGHGDQYSGYGQGDYSGYRDGNQRWGTDWSDRQWNDDKHRRYGDQQYRHGHYDQQYSGRDGNQRWGSQYSGYGQGDQQYRNQLYSGYGQSDRSQYSGCKNCYSGGCKNCYSGSCKNCGSCKSCGSNDSSQRWGRERQW